MLLGVAGGDAGVALAYALLRVMIGIVPPDTIPDEAEIAMNVPVSYSPRPLSVGWRCLFGLAPAWHAALTGPGESLEAGRPRIR